MRLLPWTTFAAAVEGDDLHPAVVSGTPWGVRVQRRSVIHGFREMPADEAARALAYVPAGARVVLVASGEMVGVRPIALGEGAWASAREEIVRSIGSLFPLSADDALVGWVGRCSAGACESGYLVAAARSAIQPWIHAVERALHRPVDAVLSSHMALLGLGLQRQARAVVAERTPAGAGLAHRLEWGEIVELNTDRPALDSSPEQGGGAGRTDVFEPSPHDLAVGGALAPVVAPRLMAPIHGRAPRPPRRWVPAAAWFLAAGALLWSAAWAESWRLDRAIRALDAEAARRASALAEVRQNRERVRALAARLEAVAAAMPERPVGALATLAAVHATMPDGSFLYQIEADAGSIALKGEARRSGDVLRAVEDSPAFHAARELDTPVVVEERALEMFNIRAARAPGGKEGAP